MSQTHRYVLAVDNGSQSTKVLVLDEQGAIHASAQRPLRPYAHPGPGQVVHPDDDLWESICAAVREALAGFAPGAGAIEAVGLCTIRFCRALLDADGNLLEPVLSWMDERTGRPNQRSDAAWVTTSSGYITHRLTGRAVDTAANYQGVWPVDQHTARWSQDETEFSRCGLRPDQVFELVDPGEVLGGVSEDAAVATGLSAGTPVVATANDKAVEALGAGLDEDTVLLSLGTYIAAMTPAEGADSLDPDAYWVNFACQPHQYLAESNGIRRGMWTVSWTRDLLLPQVAREGESREATLDRLAADVAPGCQGLVTVLDWLAPAGHPSRRGAFLGFDGSQGAPEMYRSVLEAIAITMADNIRHMEHGLGREHGSVLVTGGGARSSIIGQVVAALLERPVYRSTVDDAAGTGAAICASVAVGIHPSVAAAQAAYCTRTPALRPDPDLVETYRPIAEDFRRVVAATRAVFDQLPA